MKKISLLSLIALLASCGDAARDSGTLSVHASGEAAAEEGYPNGSIDFVDGYTLEFTHVFLALESLTLESSTEGEKHKIGSPVLVDLHDGPVNLWEASVPAKRWDRVSYRTHVPGHDDRTLGTVTFNDIHTMITGGYAIFVQGTASQGGDTFTFSFGFPPIAHSHCENDDGTEGIVITTNSVTEAEITVHLDHLFFDSLAVDEPNLRFEPFAGSAESGDIRNVYLTAPITDLQDRNGNPIMDGPNVVVYDPGPHVLSPMTLEQYLLAAGSTMGHWNGEGHCEYTPID